MMRDAMARSRHGPRATDHRPASHSISMGKAEQLIDDATLQTYVTS